MNSPLATVLPKPMRVVAHTRPLLFHQNRLYCARYDRIVSTSDFGISFVDEGWLALALPYRNILRATHLGQRIARALVYRMRILPNGNRVYIFRGGVYSQRWEEPVARLTFSVTRGSRPVSLAASADGFVVFGEYWDNQAREAVKIFGSRDYGEHWEVVHTFAPGEVMHVHGISYDPHEGGFWICTGDLFDECRLLHASGDFRHVKMIRKGGQGNRFYSSLVAKQKVLTATDTPLEDNYICEIDKQTGELAHLTRIDNSSFFSCLVRNRFFVATNAEISSVNDVRAVHVWSGRLADGRCQRVLTLPIDLPSRMQLRRGMVHGLFQFPQLFFPEGENSSDTLVAHATGLSGIDDAMICWNAASLDEPS